MCVIGGGRGWCQGCVYAWYVCVRVMRHSAVGKSMDMGKDASVE